MENLRRVFIYNHIFMRTLFHASSEMRILFVFVFVSLNGRGEKIVGMHKCKKI